MKKMMTPIIVPKRFTEEQCKNIISLHSEGWTEMIGQIKDGIVEPSTRQNTTYVPPTIDHVPNELINDIFRVISFVNDKFFNFDLAEGDEDPRFFPMELTLLRYDLGDHYETHIDMGPSAPNRKLSFTLMLNDSFDGGELRFAGQEKKTESFFFKLQVFTSSFNASSEKNFAIGPLPTSLLFSASNDI